MHSQKIYKLKVYTDTLKVDKEKKTLSYKSFADIDLFNISLIQRKIIPFGNKVQKYFVQ
jgi:hypothetical protein